MFLGIVIHKGVAVQILKKKKTLCQIIYREICEQLY